MFIVGAYQVTQGDREGCSKGNMSKEKCIRRLTKQG